MAIIPAIMTGIMSADLLVAALWRGGDMKSALVALSFAKQRIFINPSYLARQ
jgi:hypothetical protein